MGSRRFRAQTDTVCAHHRRGRPTSPRIQLGYGRRAVDAEGVNQAEGGLRATARLARNEAGRHVPTMPADTCHRWGSATRRRPDRTVPGMCHGPLDALGARHRRESAGTALNPASAYANSFSRHITHSVGIGLKPRWSVHFHGILRSHRKPHAAPTVYVVCTETSRLNFLATYLLPCHCLWHPSGRAHGNDTACTPPFETDPWPHAHPWRTLGAVTRTGRNHHPRFGGQQETIQTSVPSSRPVTLPWLVGHPLWLSTEEMQSQQTNAFFIPHLA